MRLNESHIKYIETLDGLSLADKLKAYMNNYDISQSRAMQVLNEYSKLKFLESFNKGK